MPIDNLGTYNKTGIENKYGETILREDEVLCPLCNGCGINFKDKYSNCPPCFGDGKVNWTKYAMLKGGF
jgi:DnaJ-class molecular chaperone